MFPSYISFKTVQYKAIEVPLVFVSRTFVPDIVTVTFAESLVVMLDADTPLKNTCDEFLQLTPPSELRTETWYKPEFAVRSTMSAVPLDARVPVVPFAETTAVAS
jgi:hypothetical protein